jgi:CRP/FNR family transcriptional regulator
MSALDLLSQVPIFRSLTQEDRARVADVAHIKTYAKGDMLFSEGDPAEAFYVVATGRAKVFKMTPTGKDVILEIFGVGHPLGAVAVYEGHPFPASAMALEHTICVLIPRQAFFGLLERHPSLVRGLLLGLTRRLMELTNRLAELSGGRVEPRVARLFIKMMTDVGRPERGGIFIPSPLSRQEIADMTGTTIETCIRIMSRWNKDDLVRTEKEGFLVMDTKALETLSLT